MVLNVTCPNSHQNSPESQFCNTCGSPIVQPEVANRESEILIGGQAGNSPTPQDDGAVSSRTGGRWPWIGLSLRAKIIILSGTVLIVVGVIVGAVLGARGPHKATEADYRHAFGDIATVVIANGGSWEMPASYPNPLSSSDKKRFAQVKSVLLRQQCVYFGGGLKKTNQAIDVAVAYGKDNGASFDYVLFTNQAVIDAAGKYICPQYSDIAKKASGYVNTLLVLGS